MSRDPDTIVRALRDYLPDGNQITGISAISDGFSNETYLVAGLNLILRLPPFGDQLLAPNHVHDVVAQYRIVEEYSSRPAAPPVPRPVLVESDPAVLGAPFFLMERVICDHWGDWERPAWLIESSDAFRSGVSQQIVEMYAKLHSLSPLATLGLPYSVSAELERWHDPVRAIASPALSQAFVILLETAPASQPLAPCHGDAKIPNILWKDGGIVAMIDYEMSFNGDPRWDIASLVQNLKSRDGKVLPDEDEDGFWGRKRMLAHWQALTGRGIDRIGWFEAAARARYASILTYGQWLFDQGRDCDPRYGKFRDIAERLGQTALVLARGDAESR